MFDKLLIAGATSGAAVTANDVRIAFGVVLALLIALLAARSQALKLTREDRDAQKVRREEVELELAKALAENAELRARPNLDQHAAILSSLVETMHAHDEAMRGFVPEVTRALAELSDRIAAHAELERDAGTMVVDAVRRLELSLGTVVDSLRAVATAAHDHEH